MARYSFVFLAYLFILCFSRPVPDSVVNIVDVSSISKGQPATYTFSINTVVAVRYNSNFKVSFPPEFESLSSPVSCHVALNGVNPTKSPCTVASNTDSGIDVTIPTNPVPIGTHLIYISEVINPTDFPSTSNINVTLALQGGSVQQIVDIEGVPLVPAAIPLLDLEVTLDQRFSPDRVRRMTFSVLTQRFRGGPNTIHMRIPFGVSIVSDTVTVRNAIGHTHIYTGVRTPDLRSIFVYNVTEGLSYDFFMNFTISTQLNYENNWLNLRGCRFEVNYGPYPQTWESSTNNDLFIVTPLSISPSVNPGTVVNGSVNTFGLSWASPLAIDSFFDIFIEISDGSTLLQECQPVLGVSQSASCSINGTVYTLSDIGSIASGANNLVNLFIQAPAQRRINITITIGEDITITIIFRFRQTQAVVATGSIPVHVTMRSINALRSLTYNPLNVASNGQTALLHFYFKFVTPMPGTNARTDGKIVLEISPQIPKPDTYLRKLLRCFFFRLQEATECYWDNTHPDKSVISIKTPSSFDNTDVDLEFNTYDPVLNKYYGIPLNPHDDPYYFKVYTFHNNDTIPSDIYEQVYQPVVRSINFLTSDLTSRNPGDDAGLQFQFRFPTVNIVPGRDYFIRAVFTQANGFAQNLGYPQSNEAYVYPCWAVGIPIQPHCLLYTSNAGNPNTEIHVYGNFSGTIPNILFPRLKIGAPPPLTSVKVLFTITENMPGILNNYPSPLDLYRGSQSWGPFLTQANIPTTTGNFLLGLNATTPQISAVNLTITLSNFNHNLVDEGFVSFGDLKILQSSEDLTDRFFDVFYFKTFNVVWIRRKASPPGATYTLNIRCPNPNWNNGPWLGPWIVFFRAYNGDTLTQVQTAQMSFDSFFPIALAAAEPNQKLYANYHHLINVTGTLSVPLNQGSSIQVDVTGFEISNDAVPYCIVSVDGVGIVGGADITGMKCVRRTANSLLISNFQEQRLRGWNITITITIKITFRAASGSVTMTTFYNSDGTNVLERSRPNTYSVTLFSATLLDNFRMLSEYDPQNDKASFDLFSFDLTPININITTVKVTFPQNTTIPQSDFICFINGKVSYCSVNTTGQLSIIFVSDVPIIGTTQFQFSPNGITYNGTAGEYGLEPGYYEVLFELFDQTANLQETQHTMVFLRPDEVKEFTARAFVSNINFDQTIWRFRFKLGAVIRDWADQNTPYRIYFQFPTNDGGFLTSIGQNRNNYDQLPCYLANNGVVDTAVTCSIISSNEPGVAALIAVNNFSQIASSDNVEVWIVGINHPTTMTSYPPVGIIVTKIKYLPSIEETLVLATLGRGLLATRNIAVTNTAFSRTVVPIIISSTGPYDPGNSMNATITVPAGGMDNTTFVTLIIPPNVGVTRDTIITCPNGACFLLSDLKTLLLDVNQTVAGGSSFIISFQGFEAPVQLYWKFLSIVVYISTNRIVSNIFTENYDKAKLSVLVGNEVIEVKGTDYDQFSFNYTKNQIAQRSEIAWLSNRGVPAGGSVFIKFTPSVNVYGGCQSLSHLNADPSGMKSTLGDPFISCQVTSGGLIVSPRDHASGLATGKRMHLAFVMDTPNTNTLQIEVSSFVSNSPNLALENPIEKGTTTINLRNVNGISATAAVPIIENVLLQPGDNTAFEFHIKLTENYPNGLITEISFPARGLKGQTADFAFRPNQNWNSLVTDMDTGDIIPSRIAVAGRKFTITITISISIGKRLKVETDTHNNAQEINSGLRWPSVADWYLLEFSGKNPANTQFFQKTVPIKITPPSFGTFRLSNKGSLSSQLIVEARFNLTASTDNTQSLIFNFYGKGGNQAAVNSLLADLQVDASSKSAIVDGGCILWPGQHRPQANFITVGCPLSNNISSIRDEIVVYFSFKSGIFIGDIDIVVSSEMFIQNNNGTILYYYYSPDRILVKPIPAAYQSIPGSFVLAPLTIQYESSLSIDVPCPNGVNKGDTISILAGFGYDDLIETTGNFNCTPECEVVKIDKNIILRQTGSKSFGTRITVNGLKNPNYVKPIGSSVIVCAYDQNPFLFQAFNYVPDVAQNYYTILPLNAYQLSSSIVPNFRKNTNAISLRAQGNFILSAVFAYQFPTSIPIYKLECYTGLNSEVQITNCNFDIPTAVLYVNTVKYNDGVVRTLDVIVVIGVIGSPVRRIYTLQPQVQIFAYPFPPPPLSLPWIRQFGVQYINTFDSFAFEVQNQKDQDFFEFFSIQQYNSFGINKKPTFSDPACCYWFRYQVYVNANTLPTNIDFKASLLSNQVLINLPGVSLPFPKSNLCFVNNNIKNCAIVQTPSGVNVTILNIGANEVNNNIFDFQIGFYVGQTGVIDGFYLVGQDLFRVAVSMFPAGSNVLHSNYLSDILLIKPKLLPKFKIQNPLNVVTGQRNVLTFRINNGNFLRTSDKPRYVIGFQVGRNASHLFRENLGSFTHGAAVPCVAISNMGVTGQLTCYFVHGHSYGKFGIDARIYVEGFNVTEPSLDVVFRIAGFMNPMTPCAPNFYVQLFKMNSHNNYDLLAYNEIYGALNFVNNPSLVLNTNPNDNLIDIVGGFWNARSRYRVIVDVNLDNSSWILLEISGNVGFCQFTEDGMSMIGKVDAITMRFLQVRANTHTGGNHYSFRSFICGQPGDIIKAYIYNSDLITGEVLYMQFPNDAILLGNRNRIPVVNSNDVRASMNVNQRPGQVYGTVTINMAFSANFLLDQSGFLQPQYGMLATITIDPSLFIEISNICYVSGGFSSSSPTSIVLCSVTPTGQVVVSNWDNVILFNNASPGSIIIVFLAKLKSGSFYSSSISTQVTLQFFSNQLALNGSYPYFNLYVPLRPISYTTNRLLAGETEKGLLPKGGDRMLAANDVYLCQQLATNVAYSILGYTNSQTVEISISIGPLNVAIGVNNNLAVFTKNWQFNMFLSTWDQIRAYPCLCNVQTDCYYYPPRSLNSDSPFNDPALIIDFRNVVNAGSSIQCTFPGRVSNLNNALLQTMILTDNFLAYDDEGEIRNLGGCQQEIGVTFVQGNQLNFTLSVDSTILNSLTFTLNATSSQFFTSDFVILDLGTRILWNNLNTGLICANFTNCRVYTTGTLVIVGNPRTNTSQIVVQGVRYNGWVDDGTPDYINASVYTNAGAFRGSNSTNLPFMNIAPIPAVLSIERPSAYVYENILFTLQFRTGNYQLRTHFNGFFGGNAKIAIKNLTFAGFQLPQACFASTNIPYFNFFICSIVNTSAIEIYNYWGFTIPANTTFTVQFRGQLLNLPPPFLPVTFTLLTLPGNSGYQQVLNTQLNLTYNINTTIVLPQSEINAKNIYLWPTLHENYPYESGPLKARFLTSATDVVQRIKISSFSVQQSRQYFPLCWINEFNLDVGERLLPEFPFDSFFNFCTLGDDGSAVFIDYNFKQNTNYEIVFTLTNGTSSLNNLFNLDDVDNIDFEQAFQNHNANFTLYNSSARINSWVQTVRDHVDLDFQVTRIEVTSKESNKPKTMWIQIITNEYVPADPRGVIDINFPSNAYNGMFNGWSSNIYNPIPPVGTEVPCDVVTNTLDFGNDRGLERPVCVFTSTLRSSLYPVTVTVKNIPSLSRGETVNIFLYQVLGPNSINKAVASLVIDFVQYPFESQAEHSIRTIDHVFQTTSAGNTLNTPMLFTIAPPDCFLQKTGVSASVLLNVATIPGQPLTSPISASYVEFKMPEFLRRVNENVMFGSVAVNGVTPATVNRDHRNGIIFMVFSPPLIVISSAFNFTFGNLTHHIFPCSSCAAGYIVISDGLNIRLQGSVQYPYASLAYPPAVGFLPNPATISNFNNENKILTLNVSIANRSPWTHWVKIKIPDVVMNFVNCRVSTDGTNVSEVHSCTTYNDGTYSSLIKNVSSVEILSWSWGYSQHRVMKIEVYLPGGIPPTLNFIVEEYYNNTLFQTSPYAIAVTNQFTNMGTSTPAFRSSACCYHKIKWSYATHKSFKTSPRADTNKFWFKAAYPANFGTTFNGFTVTFLEASAHSLTFANSQFICSYLEPDLDGDGINDVVFATSCSYNATSQSFTIGVPQSSSIVPSSIGWQNTVVYIECFLTGLNCFKGLRDQTPIRISTNGIDTILYYSEASLNFNKISLNYFSNNAVDADFFNYQINQFGEYGNYLGEFYDFLFVEVAFWNRGYNSLYGVNKEGGVLLSGQQLSVPINSNCKDIQAAHFPGSNAASQSFVIYPENMISRTRTFQMRLPFITRPPIGQQILTSVRILGFFKSQVSPNVLASKFFYFQQNAAISSPSAVPLTVVANNLMVNRNDVSFNITFPTVNVSLDASSLIIYGFTTSADAVQVKSFCPVTLPGYRQDQFVFGQTVYFFASPVNSTAINASISNYFSPLKSGSSRGQVSELMFAYYNDAWALRQGASSQSTHRINNQTFGEFDIVYGNLFKNNSGIYRTTFVLPHILESSGKIFFKFPPQFDLTEDLDYFQNCEVMEGLAPLDPSQVVQCSKVAADTYVVSGFRKVNITIKITIHFALFARDVGTNLTPLISIYSAAGLLQSVINNIPGLTIVNQQAPIFLRKVFGIRVDALYPGSRHNLRISFSVTPTINFNPGDSRTLIVDMDTDFVIDPNTIIWGYYRDTVSNIWIDVSRGVLTGNLISFDIRNITTLVAGETYDFFMTFELGDVAGLLMPAAGFYNIGIRFIINGQLTYISFIDLLILPAPFTTDACIYNPLVKELTKSSTVQLTLQFRSTLLPNDEIWIKLQDQAADPAITSLARLYPWDYEYPIELSFDDRSINQNPRSVLSLASASDKGTIKIKLSAGIETDVIFSVFIPNLINPNSVMYAHARVSLMRVCRTDGRLLCEILYGDLSYLVLGSYSSTTTPFSLVLNNDLVSFAPSPHLFTFTLTENMFKNDYFLVNYPNPFLTFPETCVSSVGQCIAFPSNQQAIIRVAAPVLSGTLATMTISLSNANYQSVAPLVVPVKIQSISNVRSVITQNLIYTMPSLLPIPHTGFAQTVMNSKNFNGFVPQLIKGKWNTVQFVAISFFDIFTERLVIQMPSVDVTQIDNTLCNATLTVPSNQKKYPQALDCAFSGSKVIITPSANFDRSYAYSDANNITFYLRIFVRGNTLATNATFQWSGFNSAGTGLRKYGESSLVIERVNIPLVNTMDLMAIPATLSRNYDIHVGINAVTTSPITIITFDLPSEFTTSTNSPSPVTCNFIGANIVIFNCFLNPSGPNNGIRITALIGNYFGQIGVLKISGLVPRLITLPNDPKVEYVGSVTLLRGVNDPLEILLSTFNLILYNELNNISVQTYLNPALDSNVYLTFDVGSRGLEKGFPTTINPVYSKIVIEFYQAEGYESILGYNGLTIPIIDCVGINITPSSADGLNCVLVPGQMFSNPEIHISNFQAIAPNTQNITLIIGKITTPGQGHLGGVRVLTRRYVNDVLNPSFIATLPIACRPNERQGSQVPPVAENGNFSLRSWGKKWNITITITISFRMAAPDTLEVLLPYNLWFRDVNSQSVLSNWTGQVYVFEKIGMLLFTGANVNAGALTLEINGLVKPPFTVIANTTITSRLIVGNIVQDLHYHTAFVNSPAGTSIDNFAVTLRSNQGGFCNNELNITARLGYSLQADGVIRISVPPEYLAVWDPTGNGGCTPQFPFPPHRKCTRYNNNQFLISADGVAPPTQDINIRFTNICLPNRQITTPFFLFAQYNSSNSSIFSMVTLPAPAIVVTTVFNCSFGAALQFPNAEEWSDYSFNVNCTGNTIRPRTTVIIRFPGDFADALGPRSVATDGRCSISGILSKQDYCKVVIDNFVWVYFRIENVPASNVFTLTVHDVFNPAQNVYRFIMQMESDNFIYGQSASTAALSVITKRLDKSTPLLARSYGPVPPSASQISSTVIFTTRMANFNQVAQVVFKFDDDASFNFEGRAVGCRAYLFTDFLTLNLDSYYWRELNNSTETLSCTRTGRNIYATVSNNLRSSTKHIAWVLDGIRNPALNVVRTVQIFYLNSNLEVFWSGRMPIDTSSFVPIKPLLLHTVTSNLLKQRAFSLMNFTMDPFESFTGETEVALHLSDAYSLNNGNPTTFCIDDNNDNIDCLQEGLQYSIRNYNRYQNRVQFNYGMTNIINPSSQTCNYGGNNPEQFHADIVNFRTRGLVYKTFRELKGRNNCLEYVYRNFTVNVTGPTLVYPGTSQTYTINLEAGPFIYFAVDIRSSNPIRVTALPSTVNFTSLFVVSKTFNLNLDLGVPQGPLALNFITQDPGNTYDDLPPMILTVGNIRNAPNTTVFVEAFSSIENNNSPQYLFIYLRNLPPLTLIVNIDSNGTLGVQFNPTFLTFNPSTNQGFISVRCPPTLVGSITLRLFITGPNGEYVPYAFATPVITVPIINRNQGVQLDYTLVQRDDIGRNNATVTVCFNKPAFCNYILVPGNTFPPSQQEVLTAGNGNPLYIASGKVRTLLNNRTNTNCTQLYLFGLDAATSYSLYVVGDDGAVPTPVRQVNFQTSAASDAIVLYMYLGPNDDINAIALVMAQILGVDVSRIIILPINRRLLTSGGQVLIRALIRPENKVDDASPSELAHRLQTRQSLSVLKRKFPSFDVAKGIRAETYRAAVPSLSYSAGISSESYNSVTFTFNLTGDGTVYGIRVPVSVISSVYQNSLNLLGIDVYNGKLPNNVALPTSDYVSSGTTAVNSTIVNVGFNDVEDGRAFRYFFVLADKVNMNPPALAADLITIDHTTKKNPYSQTVDL